MHITEQFIYSTDLIYKSQEVVDLTINIFYENSNPITWATQVH